MAVNLFTYGTLKTGEHPLMEKAKLIHEGFVLEGFAMYDLGVFPGIQIVYQNNQRVVGNVYKVPSLKDLDQYEGYNQNDPKGSLFIRSKVHALQYEAALIDGPLWTYIYNGRPQPAQKIENGVWDV